jgi:hypothetical protein
VTILVAAETLLLALLALFVIALLRSHAEILRRLELVDGTAGLPQPREAPAGERRAQDLEGATPSGGARRIALAPGPDTLLAFLSSGCATCAALVASIADAERALPAGTRVVVVTKDRHVERLRTLRPLEPVVDVVMSSAAWDAFAVPGSPYFVHVDGRTAAVLGEGSATTWERVGALVVDAVEDVRGDDAAAPRIDAVLEAAGIGPGHASLHPSRGADGTS